MTLLEYTISLQDQGLSQEDVHMIITAIQEFKN